jgi:hypothetical protein
MLYVKEGRQVAVHMLGADRLRIPAAMFTHSGTELTVKFARLAGTCR